MNEWQWYTSGVTGEPVSPVDMHALENIFGERYEAAKQCLIQEKILIPLENPTVIDILKKSGSVVKAGIRYSEIHHTGVLKSDMMVKKIKTDMERFAKKKTNNIS